MPDRRRRRRRRAWQAAGAFGVGFGSTLAVAVGLGWPRPRPGPGGGAAPPPPRRAPAPPPAASAVPDLPPEDRPPPPQLVTLAFVGDIRFPGPPASTGARLTAAARAAAAFAAAAEAPGAWAGVRAGLAGADIGVGNLETAVAGSGVRARGKRYTFRASAGWLDGARAAGLSVFSLANNHSLDYGTAALLETVANVRARGGVAVGAGVTAAEAYAPAIVEVRGVRVGFLSFTRVLPTRSWAAQRGRPGVASGYATARVLSEIDRLRPRVDVLVVLMHWGAERSTEPRAADRALAKAMVESGATLVVGHHPHVLQAMEWTGGSLVAYSLGNFVFPAATAATRSSGVLTVQVGRDGVAGARFLPLRVTDAFPHALAPDARDSALRAYAAALAPAGIALAPDGALTRVPPARSGLAASPPLRQRARAASGSHRSVSRR